MRKDNEALKKSETEYEVLKNEYEEYKRIAEKKIKQLEEVVETGNVTLLMSIE